MINPTQFAKGMIYTMMKVKLETEKSLLKRMLEDGSIDQSTYDKVRADCNETFISAIEIADKKEIAKEPK